MTDTASQVAVSPLASLATVGHGIVLPRRDGWIAGCGGPEQCKFCARDAVSNAKREAAQ